MGGQGFVVSEAPLSACPAERVATNAWAVSYLFAPTGGLDERLLGIVRDNPPRLDGTGRREPRVGGQGKLQVTLCGGRVAERGGDSACVVPEQWITGPGTQGFIDVRPGLAVAAEAMEGPGHGVRGSDRGGRLVGFLSEVERPCRVAMVRFKEREVEVDDDTTGLEQLDLRTGKGKAWAALSLWPAAAWVSPSAMTYSGSGTIFDARS